MRKVLIALTAALLSLPAIGHAQLPSLGIKGGLNLAEISESDADYKAGLNIGAFASFSAGPMLAIQPEVLFSQKGAKYDSGGSFDISYVEVPLLLKLSPSLPGAGVRPIFFAGPSAGFLLSAKSGDTDVKDLLKSTDFGLTIGGGVEMGRLAIDARYNLGLSSIDDVVGASSEAIKNRAITVMLGLFLF